MVLPGDTSWGLSLEEALADFQFLEALPGKKILLKGNHDYWWCTMKKMEDFFTAHGLNSLRILHNNCVVSEGVWKVWPFTAAGPRAWRPGPWGCFLWRGCWKGAFANGSTTRPGVSPSPWSPRWRGWRISA